MTLNTAQRIANVLQLYIESFRTFGTFVIDIDEQTPGRVMDSIISLWYGGQQRTMLSIDRSDARGVWYALRDSIRYYAHYDRSAHSLSYERRKRAEDQRGPYMDWYDTPNGRSFSYQGTEYVKVNNKLVFNPNNGCVWGRDIFEREDRFAKLINRSALKTRHIQQIVKRAMYRADAYAFPVPPVPHARWNEDDWIRYIDNNGSWLMMN